MTTFEMGSHRAGCGCKVNVYRQYAFINDACAEARKLRLTPSAHEGYLKHIDRAETEAKEALGHEPGTQG